ncbi:MAG: prolipoprotein diacylglyceryl transferase [Oscillospiraceae bacterium]|nr:prolipoprotein diacylglyceryl transferase [Oscillospiraceae bacterium]
MDVYALPESFPGAVITFPMLGEGFAIDPSSTYTLFGRTFYWYGAIIGLGFLLGVIYCFRRGPRDFGVSTDTLTDAVIIGLPSALIGARLFYVLGHWEQYAGDTVLSTLWNWCKIWEGGSAIPGGLMLMLLCVRIYARRKKISFGAIMDTAAFGLMIGQIVGRWSNFMNREYLGRETEIFCRMGLTTAQGVTYYLHPLFLYESLWMLLGFLGLHIWSKRGKRKYDGQVLLFYLAWYGFIRLLLEGLRTSPLLIPGTPFRASQVLMGAVFVVAASLLLVNSNRPHDPAKLYVNIVRAGKETEKKNSDGPKLNKEEDKK